MSVNITYSEPRTPIQILFGAAQYGAAEWSCTHCHAATISSDTKRIEFLSSLSECMRAYENMLRTIKADYDRKEIPKSVFTALKNRLGTELEADKRLYAIAEENLSAWPSINNLWR